MACMNFRGRTSLHGITFITRMRENGSARIKINLYGSPSIFHSLTPNFISLFATIKNIIASEAIFIYMQ